MLAGTARTFLRSLSFTRSAGVRTSNIFDNDRLTEIFKDNKQIQFDNLPPIFKDNYSEHGEMRNLDKEIISEEMKANEITMSDHLNPIMTFDHLMVNQNLVSYMKKRFATPTAIQKFSWPPTLAGKDLVGLSVTGSGKTLSFGLPMMHTITKNKDTKLTDKTLAVVLLPSWELAKQVYGELTAIASSVNLGGAIFVGGEMIKIQMHQYYKNRDFIVATPGRLIDLITRGVIDLSGVCYMVLDEADRMMDMGFEPQIKAILKHIRPDRQLTMWSATWPVKVSNIACDYAPNAFKIKVGNGYLAANKNIEQRIKFLANEDKINELMETLNGEFKNKRAIVFCNTMFAVDFVNNKLKSRSIDSIALHGQKERQQRVKIYDGFKNGESTVLVATDVASRGLDVSDIDLVVVYDIPNDFESYIHRIGRTGRNKKGISIAFFTRNDRHHAGNMMQALNSSGQVVPDELHALASHNE